MTDNNQVNRVFVVCFCHSQYCHNMQKLIKVVKSQDTRQLNNSSTIHSAKFCFLCKATIFKSEHIPTPDLKAIYVLKYSHRDIDELLSRTARTNNWCKLSTSEQELFSRERCDVSSVIHEWSLSSNKAAVRYFWSVAQLTQLTLSNSSGRLAPTPPTFTLIRSLSMVLIKQRALEVQSGMYLTI